LVIELPFNFFPASFPDPKLLLRAQKKFGTVWIGGSHPENGACQRTDLNGQWTWVSGDNLPLSYPYWYKGADEFGIKGVYEPTTTRDCCLVAQGVPGTQKPLFSAPCNATIDFLCQFLPTRNRQPLPGTKQFPHNQFFSSFSSSRSNRNVTSFQSNMGPTDQRTNGPTDQRTNGPT
jgi:hypothetical protein